MTKVLKCCFDKRRLERSSPSWAIFFFAFALNVVTVAYSQEETGVGSNAATDHRVSTTVNQSNSAWPDVVDTFSGNLSIKHLDLDLPGNGGMDLKIYRTYNLGAVFPGANQTEKLSYEWSMLGPGWTITASPKIVANSVFFQTDTGSTYYLADAFQRICSGNPINAIYDSGGWEAFQFSLILPSGERQGIYYSGGAYALTKNNWKIQCVGSVIKAYSPGGVVYEFGDISGRKVGVTRVAEPFWEPQLSSAPPPNQNTDIYMVAKKAIDSNGNWISYEYEDVGSPYSIWNGLTFHGGVGYYRHPDWSGGVLLNRSTFERPSYRPKRITTNDGREVSFRYSSATDRLESIQDNAGRAVTYSYYAEGATSSLSLYQVTHPGNRVLSYEYHPGPFGSSIFMNPLWPTTDEGMSARKLKSIAFPEGGKVSYLYSYYFEYFGDQSRGDCG